MAGQWQVRMIVVDVFEERERWIWFQKPEKRQEFHQAMR